MPTCSTAENRCKSTAAAPKNRLSSGDNAKTADEKKEPEVFCPRSHIAKLSGTIEFTFSVDSFFLVYQNSMILEKPIPEFAEWFLPAAAAWLMAVAALLGITLGIGFIFALIWHGKHFPRPFVRTVQRGLEGVTSFSAARTWAVALLTVKESLRRRVIFIFAMFMVLLLMAGWFLDPNSEDPARLYLSFVSGATMVLVLLLSLFLSAFGLPTEFKTKTIYSIVTKPLRSSEIVLGRIIGVSVISTAMLIFMGIASYFFVTNGLRHTHLLEERTDLTPVSLESGSGTNDPRQIIFQGETRLTNGHKHPVTVFADGSVSVAQVNGHTHQVTVKKEEGKPARYTVHDENGTMQARIPVYCKQLSFRKGDNIETSEGINVGEEWEYRSYIAGAADGKTASEAAIFCFRGISESAFNAETIKQGIPVEMKLGVFRTIKADIEQRVNGSLSIRNPKTGLKVELMTFSTEEFITKTLLLPRTFEGTPQIVQRRGRNDDNTLFVQPDDRTAAEGRNNTDLMQRKNFDLFQDFVADGEVEIWLQCLDRMQYIGVAPRDLYLRAADAPVGFNFAKSFFSIWMQMIILTSFGVLFSTFLSGPIAMISTVGVMIAGFAKSFMIDLGLNKVLGGGPFESLYRLLIQQNLVTDLPSNMATSFVKFSDQIYAYFLLLLGQTVPPLSEYGVYDKALVQGFDIPAGWLLNHSVTTLAYVIPVVIAAYLILNNREVAK
ncbi:MAG: hypothetical protein LBH00_05455 [Planctomycetaceae bacterium]|nr:hypothetical protein [Planctomycetaceae bacterium]